MTLYEYHLLTEAEQVDLLYQEGIYLGKRKFSDLSIVLYQLDDFYVEVYYDKYRYLINQVKYFHSTDLLQPYLEQIDVEELIKYVE
jgi:hypothetical protein